MKFHHLFRFRHHKLLFLILMVIASYALFSNPTIQSYFLDLNELSYLSIFIAGVLFAFGFTAPIAIGMFLIMTPDNLLLASIIGGLGAMLGDQIIFRVIKGSFMDDFNELKSEKWFKKAVEEIDLFIHKRIRNYLLYILAGIVIASPLPDEIGVTMLAGLTRIKPHVLAEVSFVLHVVGIYLLLLI